MDGQELVYELQDGAVEHELAVKLSKTFNDKNVPQEFSHLVLEKGTYCYGFGNVADEVDEQGDEVVGEAFIEGTKDLDKAPYNKVFISHNYQKIACGKIVYKTIVKVGGQDKLLILAKLNEHLTEFPEIIGSINEGYLDSFSVGGSYGRVQKVFDQERGRYINKVLSFKVREVSLTSYPANGKAKVLGTFHKTREVIKQLEATRMAQENMKKDAPADLKKEDPAAEQMAEMPAEQPAEPTWEQKVSALSEQVAGLSSRLEAAESAIKEMASKESPAPAAPEEEVAKSEESPEEKSEEEPKEEELSKSLPKTEAELKNLIQNEFKKYMAPANDAMRKSVDAAAASKPELKKDNSTTAHSSTPLLNFLKPGRGA